jgi:16S rRNA (cytosine967-C5)-methyltransferase
MLAERAVHAIDHPAADRNWSRDPALARLAWVDRQLVLANVRSVFRWWGWLTGLSGTIEQKLLIGALMDATEVTPLARHWAERVGLDPARLVSVGDAPSWTARTEGFKRLAGGESPLVDPWRLFPRWLRDSLPPPPGDEPLKVRHVRFFEAVQSAPPFWLRSQGAEPEAVWNELRTLGLKPWIHRRFAAAARLEHEVELSQLPPAGRGLLEVHDFSSQLVGVVCDPHSGERWWVPHAERPQESIHLASLMQGRGSLSVGHERPTAVRALTLQARHTPFRNISVKQTDGKHVVGKPGSYDGVLVTPPSTSMGLWRRLPESRWLSRSEPLTWVETQLRMVALAARALKPGGLLVFAVPTLTRAETTDLVHRVADELPELRLKPFANPLSGEANDGVLSLWPRARDVDALFLARWTRLKVSASI